MTVDVRDRLCPNCGAALYPRPAVSDQEKWRFGRPFSKSVGLAFLIVGGLAASCIGGCGLFFGITKDEYGFYVIGRFCAVLGLAMLLYVIWEARRAFGKK
jgi:hypothetical protein